MPEIARVLRTTFAIALLAFAGNASRPGRAAYLVMTLAITVAAWLGLAAMASPFVHATTIPTDSDITVRSARRGQALPQRYATQIATLPGALDVMWLDLQLVSCGSKGDTVTLNAIGGAGVPRALAQGGVDAQSAAAWDADPLGILVDEKTARQCGWHTGMGLKPTDISGRPLDIHVSGIYRSNADSSGSAYAHYSYINHVAPFAGHGNVLVIHAHARDPRDNDALAARIEDTFAYNAPPVEATPNTVNQNAWARFGKVQYLLAGVMAAIFLCCALVLVSVLAHAAAQRKAQMALLHVLGFTHSLLLSVWLLESLLIVLIGTTIGSVLGLGAIHIARRTLGGSFGGLAPPPWAWEMLPVWMLALLFAALIAPTMTVMRLRTTDCHEL